MIQMRAWMEFQKRVLRGLATAPMSAFREEANRTANNPGAELVAWRDLPDLCKEARQTGRALLLQKRGLTAYTQQNRQNSSGELFFGRMRLLKIFAVRDRSNSVALAHPGRIRPPSGTFSPAARKRNGKPKKPEWRWTCRPTEA